MAVERRRFLGQGLLLAARRLRPAGVGAGSDPALSPARPAGRRAARRPGDALAGPPVRGRRRDARRAPRRRTSRSGSPAWSSGRPQTATRPDRFTAVCLKCPHEGCDVDFVADPNRLPQEVKDEIGQVVKNAVYVCPCHNSTFKAEDGERLAGPAPRGLYRFRVTSVTDAAVEIGEVEEDVLIFV